MHIHEKQIILKNGMMVTLRTPQGTDAAGIINFRKEIVLDTYRTMDRNPDEIETDYDTVYQKYSELYESEEKLIHIYAFMNDQCLGMLSFGAVRDLTKLKHRCWVGLSIRKAYRGLGLGTRMLEEAFAFARGLGFEMMELEVIEGNEPVHALYKKTGFLEYGKRPHSFKLDDGSYLGAILMYKMLIS